MANISQIRVSGTTYDILDSTALHTLDSTVTSGGTNAVQGSGIYNAITASTAAALQTVSEAGYQTSGDVQSAISGKAEASDVNTLSGTVTAHTANTDIHVTAADKTAWNAKADIADIPSVSGYADSVKYDSNAKEMKFYHGGTGGTEVFSFDASPFLIDGMVSNVEIKDVTISGESVTCLVISFNTDAGKQDINIPLTEIFDPSNYVDVATYTAYTASTSTAIGNKADTSAVTADIAAAVSGKADSSAVTQEISAAVSGKQDTLISGTSIKTINNESLLGSGNITIEQGTVDTAMSDSSENAVQNKVIKAYADTKNPMAYLDGTTLVIS